MTQIISHRVLREASVRASSVDRTSGSPPRAWGRRPHILGLHGEAGSPPRAWGRLGDRHPRAASLRFTPTCVGKTPTFAGKSATTSVHPHVRGEDCPSFATPRHDAGSPPRAWGRRNRPNRTPATWRFTPTCVGKTNWHSLRLSHCPGSPPRAWGRHCRVERILRTCAR